MLTEGPTATFLPSGRISQVLAIIVYDIISHAFNDAVECTINHHCPGDHLSAKKVAYIAASFLALTRLVHDMYHVYQVGSADVVSPATRQDLVPYISRLALLCYFVPVIWLYCRSQRRVKINYLLNQAHKAPPAWCPKLNHAKNVNEVPFGTVRKFFRGIYLVSKACVRLYWTNLVRGPVDQDAPIDYWDFDHVYTWVHGEFCDELTPNQSYHSKQNAQYVKRLRERPPSRLKRIA
ncbi:hypothetical protein I316_03087 [Kwoniella heveanensis BCC8398]|uniref:Uncharacterized protein n=1 Tax=Kwoniella heveanensis BCC8398 TaxID=1296120 RepID=A0A1B9GVH4_9TREE|nr:hypothetical protein I316_03087 [Kwoniella heveanensis BCC8398]